MSKEIWKDIIGFEGLYQVSNKGRVKTVEHKRTLKHYSGKDAVHTYPEKLVSQSKSGGKYYKVSLYNLDGAKTISVHRLVAEAFVPNPDNLPCINHKNENMFDNCASNLEWCTHKYNNNYGKHNDAISKPVIAIGKDGFAVEYKSASDAARKINKSSRSVSRWCRANATMYGYTWKYKEG